MYNFLIEGHRKYGTSKEMLCQSVLGCTNELIRETVIIAPWWEPSKLDGIDGDLIVDKSVKVWDCTLFGKNVTFIKTGIGASVCTDAILALGNTKCKKIIFIGSVGALDSKIGIGDIVIPNLSICGDGVCRYLEKDINKDCFGEKYYPDNQLNQVLISNTEKICKENDVSYAIVNNFSVDTIFAQFAHLDSIMEFPCKTIEMETAAAFKAGSICKIATVAIFNVSDNSMINKSLYSGRTEEEHMYRKRVIKEIVPQIIYSII
ncbi:phosphorylase [Clostridium sp. BL-8]|uniref:phosphorylase family protein n=1 Tax=Clostridium sp. BL-8 TaxID=349938 RepID=UPI00098BDFB6|nr:phosphorylase [Clostridium sp. BL-8]OOM67611.1 purine nucleoside phosphorylase DeoD-type [Clostridium sp. BL-8]